ncbi:MAG: cellulose synthase [Streptosporangiaceae bacterium]|nr:cellulose synthase [Streptosporangiaceae bacterium]MBV9854078.1 cellulose synthase [Streptosporangiaceae bacterium]
MSTYNSIAWLPLCAGLTGIGVVLSVTIGRRRGMRAMLRGVAWSLLPLAAYLTGSIEMFWKIGSAIGDYAKSFVFSPKVWSGIAVAGLALVLFVASGGRRRARARRRAAREGTGTDVVPAGDQRAVPAASRPAATATAGDAAKVPVVADTRAAAGAKRGRKGGGDADDDDMREIEEILRRRGIS